MSTNVSSYKQLYLKTARERIDSIMSSLERLRNHLSDEEKIEQIYRDAHSLKGQSMVMGFKKTGEAAKKIEEFFYPVKNKKKTLTQEAISAVHEVISNLIESLKSITEKDTELDLSKVLKNLDSK